MKFASLKSKLAVAAPLALVGVFGASHVVVAQPAGKAGGRKGGKKGLPAKVQEKIEAAMGKPLTDDQKKDLVAATKTQKDAVKDAQDKYDAEVVRITGLTLDQVHALKPTRKKGGADGATVKPGA